MGKRNRKHSIIDGLPSDLKDAVDEMLKANFTYHEVAEYVREHGVTISISSVQRYAKGLEATIQSLRLSQENLRMVMEETERYPDLDMTGGILRLLASQTLEAINRMPEEKLQELDFETLSKQAVALTRAAAYKKNVDLRNKDVLEIGAEQFQTALYDAMKEQNPALYKEFQKFIKEQRKKQP